LKVCCKVKRFSMLHRTTLVEDLNGVLLFQLPVNFGNLLAIR